MPPRKCDDVSGCTYSQGYWKRDGGENPPIWPNGTSRSDTFFQSGQTWQQVLDTSAGAGQGYYQLAHQYIAAMLNKANGASEPQGIQDTITLAYTWLSVNGPSVCTAGGSCGDQKAWAAILDSYNKGDYAGGPKHCE
jgi:hypothetical protein